ncbi:MAG: glucosaminidase domain-containing protein [Lachnospiraceae bacterium]|uniref:glucosaminidase domain-containing protein n=1 Tax=Porcincola sp. LCP21S3_C12 TaxID=3438798 RepID=UPI002972D07E|nr:glucosaminidase domain-containing protein [Lachnospiraceae bacterium]
MMKQRNITRRFHAMRAAVMILMACACLMCLLTASPKPAYAANSKNTLRTSRSAERSGAGWTREGEAVSYILPSGKKAAGFRKIGRYWYHFDKGGTLSTGWFTVKSRRYFAKKTGTVGKTYGILRTGFRKVDGVYYYFNTTGKKGVVGRQKTGWITVGRYRYYYHPDGTKASGLTTIGRKLFYFSETGAVKYRGRLVTGWKTVDGKKYYFRPTGKIGTVGAAYKNKKVKIKKKYYRFDAEGSLITNNTNTASSSTAPVASVVSNEVFIETIGTLAHADMQQSGVLASVTTAQAILESASGTSVLAIYAGNLFGMKAALSGNNWPSAWNGATYKKQTLEYMNNSYISVYADFRKYENWAQSVADHSAYLTGAQKSKGILRYAGLAGEKDYKKAASIIKAGGYATDPGYVAKLCSLIERYNLTRFD